MTQDKGTVRFEVDGPIGIITLSRPGKRNALTQHMFKRLDEVVGEVENNSDLRVLVIRGESGSVFCAGDDLAELVAMNMVQVRDFLIRTQGTFTRLEALPIPVVAAVEGHALGGGLELALACDLIVASSGAVMGLPETNLGVIPGLGGTIRLPRRVGLGRAKELVYSGRLVQADEAKNMGLVEAVYSPEEFEMKIMEFLRFLASKSPSALALAKSTINRGMDASLETGLALEREAFAYCFALPDAKEGITAFLEKRKPVFGK